ncbi:hypothetical protein G6L30_19570 [Agrobacterium rhizogenes]|nr:hypothetical protein [Rhizobium rhizogenes]
MSWRGSTRSWTQLGHRLSFSTVGGVLVNPGFFASWAKAGKHFLLFSKAGFSTDLIDFAKDETRRVHLLTPDDLVRPNR